METTKVEFRSGVHSPASFAQEHLAPYFADGTIVPCEGADYYTVCYGELCAYADRPAPGPCGDAGQKHLLAVWSAGVPDCEHDVAARPDYAGLWVCYTGY